MKKDQGPKFPHAEYKIMMYPMQNINPQIPYILVDMIPPNQGSILFQDSALNKTPRENFYISGYKVPNNISQDIPDRAWTLTFVVNVLDPDVEKVTCGSLYKFSMLNSPEISHLRKTLISPNW